MKFCKPYYSSRPTAATTLIVLTQFQSVFRELSYLLYIQIRLWIFSHFLSPAHEVGAGGIVITMSDRAAVRLCVRV